MIDLAQIIGTVAGKNVVSTVHRPSPFSELVCVDILTHPYTKLQGARGRIRNIVPPTPSLAPILTSVLKICDIFLEHGLISNQ